MSEVELDQSRCDFCRNYPSAEVSTEAFAIEAIEASMLIDVGADQLALMCTPDETDMPQILALYERLAPDDLHKRFQRAVTTQEAVANIRKTSALSQPDRAYDVIVAHGDSIIAHGGMIVDRNDGRGEIHFAVDPAYRKKRLARLMLENIIRSAQALGIDRLSAQAAWNNEPAKSCLLAIPARFGLDASLMDTRYQEGSFIWTLDLDRPSHSAICALSGLACQLGLESTPDSVLTSV